MKAAINVDDSIKLAGWLLIAALLINLVMSIVAPPIIRRLACQWIQPLTNLSAETDVTMPQSDRLWTLTVPKQPPKVHKVVQSFNQLLGRQYQVMQQEKGFIASASHELRTPPAGILGHVNLTRRCGDKHPELIAKSLRYIDQEA